ncbi:hypothetical protein OF83DRAFT_1066225, partial [Amylostereum chailletii]
MEENPGVVVSNLLSAFRTHYHNFDSRLQEALLHSTDSTMLERLRDDLDEFVSIVQENVAIFPPEEGELLRNNLAMMQTDIRLQHQYILDSSHHGAPSIVAIERTGGRGRPRITIDPTFLRWAYNMRSTSGIAQFLGVSRARVRNALLEYGIATPQENPFPPNIQEPTPLGELPDEPYIDELLDPIFQDPALEGGGTRKPANSYSRLITALQASNNNRGKTVLDLFLAA